MNKSDFALIAAGLFLLAPTAQAEVRVTDAVLQEGRYARQDCTPDPKIPDYNECLCDADIHYPQLEGVSDKATGEKLNAWFKEQASKSICKGERTSKSEKQAQSFMSMAVHYDTTFLSPELVGFKFTDWSYTGGAHGNGSIFGGIIDLNKDKILTPDDVFAPPSLPAVNQVIYTALADRPEEEIFRDQIESRKDAFIKDGECHGCTLALMRDGVHVLFQAYEVAPYVAGNPDVPIPAKLVSYLPITEALAAQKTSERH